MPPPIIKRARLHKLFILDPKGEYRGELPLDESCEVEFENVLEALKGEGLADGQSIFLGQWKVTAISGERMGLIAVSTGSLGSDELTWARTALLAAEATFGELKAPTRAQDGYDEEETEEREPLAALLEARERALERREAALRTMEENARTAAAAAAAEFRTTAEAQIKDLKAQLAEAQQHHERAQAALAAERQRTRDQTVAPPPPRVAAPPPSDRELVDVREEIEREKVFLQKRAIEFLEREETLRDRETKVEDEGRRIAQGREELDRLRAEIDAMKPQGAEPEKGPWSPESAKREIDERVLALKQRASDLNAREEQLRKRAEEIRALLNSAT